MKKLTKWAFPIIAFAVLSGVTLFSACNESEEKLCSNSCVTAFDGQCDDGGEGALFNSCQLATDCADCGER